MRKRVNQQVRDPLPKVRASIRQLREAYAAGVELGEQFAIGGRGNQAGILKEAQRRNYSDDMLRKFRQFADAKIGFSRQELEEYIGLMKRYRRAAGFGFVAKLLTIPSKRQRMAMARAVFTEGLGLAELRTRVVTTFGHRKHGGRRPKIPRTLAALLGDLNKRAAAWQRLYQVLQEEVHDKTNRVQWDDLPAQVRKRIQEVAEAADRLQQVVNKQTRRSSALR